MASQQLSVKETFTTDTSDSITLYDIIYPFLLPLTDPIGAYEIVSSSIVMGFFGKQFSTKDIPDLTDKVYFVTGGNAGLGKETILQLAKHNPGHIYLGARSQGKAEEAIAEVKKVVPGVKITWIPLDLANLQSISDAAKSFQQKSSRLDVLVNNAGVMALPNGKTSDGFEIQFGTNHVGSFFLTKLLLPILQSTVASTGDVRIVNLTSEAHNFRRMQGLELDKDKMQKLGVWEAYGNSKFANILFAREFAKRYPDITSVSVHPGVIVGTGLYASAKDRSILQKGAFYFGSFFLPDVPTGALNQIWASTISKDKLKNGQYYVPVAKASDGNNTVSNTSKDAELWDWTEREIASKGF